jgi:hypothetical protein
MAVAKDINRVIEDAMDVAKDVLVGNAARAIAPGK